MDSALAGAAGFADIINDGPGIKERIAAAKIVLEKTDNADKVLKIMGDFGANTARYANHHPWTDRSGPRRRYRHLAHRHRHAPAVFNYPLQGWSDAVVMNLLMGLAVGVQMANSKRVSYAAAGRSLPRHCAGRSTSCRTCRRGRRAAWLRPARSTGGSASQRRITGGRALRASFGKDVSTRAGQLQAFGLRHSTNAELREEWEAAAATRPEETGTERALSAALTVSRTEDRA